MAHWSESRLKVYGVLLLVAVGVVWGLAWAGVIDLDKPSQNIKTEQIAKPG